ncbi:hypothetical protein EMIT079MI2_290041 [Bacillus sp. IT-79MI2]
MGFMEMLMRQTFKMIPKEYDEGAKLKRYSFYYVLFRFVT